MAETFLIYASIAIVCYILGHVVGWRSANESHDNWRRAIKASEHEAWRIADCAEQALQREIAENRMRNRRGR